MAKSTERTEASEAGTPAMMAAMLALNPIGMTAWLKIMTDSAQFVADRLQQDLETQRAMLNCKSPADLLRLQAEFYQKAIEQYTAEATRVIAKMSKATVQSIDEAKSSHTRKYDDIPL